MEDRISLTEFREICEECQGVLKEVAKRLGVSRYTMYNYLAKNEQAKKILEEVRQRILETNGKLPKRKKITLEQFETACRGSWAIMENIASRLGVARSTVHEFIKQNKKAEEMFKQEEERALDMAESKLFKALLEGESWAIKFYLRTKGAKRGFAEKVETYIPEPPQIILEIKNEVKGKEE